MLRRATAVEGACGLLGMRANRSGSTPGSGARTSQPLLPGLRQQLSNPSYIALRRLHRPVRRCGKSLRGRAHCKRSRRASRNICMACSEPNGLQVCERGAAGLQKAVPLRVSRLSGLRRPAHRARERAIAHGSARGVATGGACARARQRRVDEPATREAGLLADVGSCDESGLDGSRVIP
jgi:hypothetical protein